MPRNRKVPPSRVVWTDFEKDQIVARAAEMCRDRPDLSGLPLLREAMSALPQGRRRKLLALSQAPWFEPGVEDETRRRELEARDAVGKLSGQFTGPRLEEVTRWLKGLGWVEADEARAREATLALLTLIHGELAALNAKLGHPVPGMPSRARANGYAPVN